ncbi:hypothetical protein SPHINGOR109_10183 [Sphingorhabdus sp. 109]|jgi:hypothetical protein|nr:hypothetical protein SPHINGOR109_10183 [Sphingorhabdus sp. 109]
MEADMAKQSDGGTKGKKQEAAANRRRGTLRLALMPARARADGAAGRSPLAGRPVMAPRGAG